MLTEAVLYEQQELEDGRVVAQIEAQKTTMETLGKALALVMARKR